MQETQVRENSAEFSRFGTIQEPPLDLYTKSNKWSLQAVRLTLKALLSIGASLGIYGITSQTPGTDCQLTEKIHTLFTFALVGLITVLTNELVEFGMNRNTMGTYSYQFWHNLQHQSSKLKKCLKNEPDSDQLTSSSLLVKKH